MYRHMMTLPWLRGECVWCEGLMKTRLMGVVVGGAIGFLIGTGTGIVGGPFGAVAGLFVFTLIGVGWGFSAAADIARVIARLRSR